MRAIVVWSIVAVLSTALTPGGGPAPPLVGAAFDHCVVRGESLEALAARFGVDAATSIRIPTAAPR